MITLRTIIICLLLNGCADQRSTETGALNAITEKSATAEKVLVKEVADLSTGQRPIHSAVDGPQPVIDNPQPMKNKPEIQSDSNSAISQNPLVPKPELSGEKSVGQVLPKIDHGPWNTILEKYVDPAGNVAYKKLASDLKPLDNYLDMLSNNPPVQESSTNEKLAYYINLYNAATVKLILDNYPVKSIKDIESPWDKKWVKSGDKQWSLGEIENDILRKMNEPRIHFAINCASVSCPRLPSKAFTAASMELQLQEVTVAFISDPTKNQLGTDPLQLSHIFDWYKADFTTNGSVLDYVNRYSSVPVKSNARIEFMEYDWGLNDSGGK